MATFDEFYASLDPDIRIKGRQFEKFVKWFLKTDPTWSSQVENVWLWNEYPKRWGPDCGIDLIFTHKNGKTWAVQSKCVSPDYDIKKSEIDSFLSESNDSKIDGRLLIASTDGIGKNAQQVINRQEKQVVCFLLEQFRQAEIDYPNSVDDLNQGKRKNKKKPRNHQIEAIQAVSKGLETADRGQVLMACGTGKTLTSLWIKEKLKSEQVLVLVPSLSLLSQTLKEWNAELNEPFKWICVCSDKSVAKDKSGDQWISNTSQIGVSVTSEILEIKNFLDESGSKVVFATYQSASLIIGAQEFHDTNDFDLVIADEAHRCAGKVSDAFGSVLDEKKIKATKRLFFTATPRILSKNIKNKSHEMDFEVVSMDDHSVFGEVLYELKFSDAISQNLLSDYEVLVIGVDDEMIKKQIVSRDLIKVDDQTILDAETVASQIALIKAIKKYDLKRIITFHNKIKNAKNFSNSFKQTFKHIRHSEMPAGEIYCDYISGSMRATERNRKLHQLNILELNERRILSNARCLSEGVDVPSLNGIAFINPKYSQTDIIQAVGRAIRKSEQKRKGIIIIPLYISKDQSLDQELILSNFEKVWQVVIALKSQDDYLMECIDQLRISKGSKDKINFENTTLEKFIFDIPEKISHKFSQSIKTLLVNNSSEDWFEKFGNLKNIYEKEGNSDVSPESTLANWCATQRNKFNSKLLTPKQVELLNSIEFTWNKHDKRWNDKFLQLKKIYEKDGDTDIPMGSSLGNWCGTQRNKFNSKLLTPKQVELLNSIEFPWNLHDKRWNDNFLQLKEYFEEVGDSCIPTGTPLGNWCLTQRQKYKDKFLLEDQIELLNSIKFPWDLHEQKWKDNFLELKKIFDKEGHSIIPTGTPLGNWCLTQRLNKKRKLLDKEKIQFLESLNFDWGKEDFIIWSEGYESLRKFYEREGHTNPFWSKYLGPWCDEQREKFKANELNEEQIKLLNKLHFEFE